MEKYKTVSCSVCGIPLFEYLSFTDYDKPEESKDVVCIERKYNIFKHQKKGYLCRRCHESCKDED